MDDIQLDDISINESFGRQTKVCYVKPDDPERCQAINRKGAQCNYRRVKGSQHCLIHGGSSVLRAEKKESLRMYRLTKWQRRMEEFRDDPDVKTLRNEVGILRMLLEERFNQMREPNDILFHMGPVSELVMKIERLVTSCHKMEASLGKLLDQQQVATFATQVVDILHDEIKGIATKITDPVIRDELTSAMLDRIGNKMLDALTKVAETKTHIDS